MPTKKADFANGVFLRGELVTLLKRLSFALMMVEEGEVVLSNGLMSFVCALCVRAFVGESNCVVAWVTFVSLSSPSKNT